MSKLHINVKINGHNIDETDLNRIEHERALHTLLNLHRLGAKVQHNNQVLNEYDIEWLQPETLKKVLLETKLALQPQGMMALIQNQLDDSAKRWKEWAKTPIAEQGVWVGQTELEIQGLGLESFQQMMHSADWAWGLSIMPEHYHFEGAASNGKQRIVETFGMTGNPTDTTGYALTALPDYVPYTPNPDYPIKLIGEVCLTDDNTPIHIGAVHELKPTENGFKHICTFYCPKHAPKVIADTHPYHFAIEMSNGFKIAYQNANK